MPCLLAPKHSAVVAKILAAPEITTTSRESAKYEMDNARWIAGKLNMCACRVTTYSLWHTAAPRKTKIITRDVW